MAANYPFDNHSLMAVVLGNYMYAGGGNSSPDKTCRYVPSFFFNDTATTEIYTLSLHDALPIRRSRARTTSRATRRRSCASSSATPGAAPPDRKSTRLNSSHDQISYAVFCL